ncbi:MAG: hypothetical protein ACRDHF_10555 [Tepidiformaceae bacterium]
MTDKRPDRVYGILVEDGRVFLLRVGGKLGLPGGIFRKMAEDRKVELKAHLWDQLGIEATRVWAQGAFAYRNPGEEREEFSGFYSVWEWTGDVPAAMGEWLDPDGVAATSLPPSAKILLTSVLNTTALRTT